MPRALAAGLASRALIGLASRALIGLAPCAEFDLLPSAEVAEVRIRVVGRRLQAKAVKVEGRG